jgi:hypothetical protein
MNFSCFVRKNQFSFKTVFFCIIWVSVTRFKGVRDPVPNWCLELISLRVTLPRLEQIA